MIFHMGQVPWMERDEIASKAQGLLMDYAEFEGDAVTAPVPIEALIERYLDIRLQYDDLEEILGMSDVLGATWVDERRIVIHSGLLDGVEGRLAFTCAHEVGHWILHRDLVMERRFQRRGKLAGIEPTIVCRRCDARLRGEWQADYFAACLLMPEQWVRDAFEGCFGPEPLVMLNRRACHRPLFNPDVILIDPALDTAKEIAGKVIEKGGFTNVSRAAMWYRLEDLGLLINRAEVGRGAYA